MDEKPGKDGKAGRAEDGGQRDIAAERENHGKDGDGGQRGPGRGDRKTPKPVATPLPPRKRSQTGNMWPSTAQRAASASRVRSGTDGHEQRAEQRAQPDGGAAFEQSRRNVAAPRPLPPERSTLVAPMLPLPTERMSWWRKMRTSRYPVGMDPSRYAATAMSEAGKEHDESEFSR